MATMRVAMAVIAVVVCTAALSRADCASCEALAVTPWDGHFGATVSTPMRAILDEPCYHDAILEAFATYRLLRWSGQELTPDEEVAFMKLLPFDAREGAAHGPQGVAGVDAEKYARWRLPSRDEILLQGEGYVAAGHHGVPEGLLSSGKPVKEWHTDGPYESQTPSVATSMYCVSVKPVGGDTLFMDARQVYANLDAESRRLFDCATVAYSRVPVSMHASGYRALLATEAGASSNTGALYAAHATTRDEDAEPSTTHPAVWVLPDGRRERALPLSPLWVDHLVANGTTLRGDDLSLALERALAGGKPSEIAYSWTPGDFVVWDNRALLHSATPNDSFSEDGLRLLHRIRLAGDQAPTGPAHCAAPE